MKNSQSIYSKIGSLSKTVSEELVENDLRVKLLSNSYSSSGCIRISTTIIENFLKILKRNLNVDMYIVSDYDKYLKENETACNS